MDKVARPVISNIAEDKLKEEMPVALSKTIDNPEYRKKVVYLEALPVHYVGFRPG